MIVQNGLPFYHNHLCSHQALHQQPLLSVDPNGSLLTAFNPEKTMLAGCVTHIAVTRPSPARVVCTSKKGLVSFALGAAMSQPLHSLPRLAALLEKAGVASSVVRVHAIGVATLAFIK